LFYIVIYRVLSFDCRYFQEKGILGDKAKPDEPVNGHDARIFQC